MEEEKELTSIEIYNQTNIKSDKSDIVYKDAEEQSMHNVFLFKPIVEKEVETREILWYDFFYKRLRKFNAHCLDYVYEKDKYIETDNGIMELSEAINFAVKYNNGMRKEAAKKMIEESCEIFEDFVFKARPVIYKKNSNIINVKKWVDSYLEYNEDSVKKGKKVFSINIIDEDEEKVVVSVPSDLLDDFCYQADRNNIRFLNSGENYEQNYA